MKPTVNAVEAIRAGWLELWYQPKIDARAMIMMGAEALSRVRHPSLGIVPPARFLDSDGNRTRLVSEHVIRKAIADWHRFFFEKGFVEIAINLPITFLQNDNSLNYFRRNVPNHPHFEGLVVEIDSTEVVRNINSVKKIAGILRDHRVAISLDDVGSEWTLLAGIRDFPFVEFKIDQKFIKGCARDAAKQSLCSGILALAKDYGARTVAEGVENWADFLTARELGFDLVQGFLFSKPVPAEQFTRICWSASPHCLPFPRSHPLRELHLSLPTPSRSRRSMKQ